MLGNGSLRRRSAMLGVVLTVTIVLLALAGGLASSFLPGSLVGRDAQSVAAPAIFAASYLALAIGRVPGLAIDRAGVALVGACLMVASGALSLEEAYKAIDLDTLTLLLGMMIVVANLRLSGIFTLASAWVMRRAHHPLALLAAVTVIAGVFSAFLVNDAICLVLAPLVLDLTLSLRRNPVPYLLAVAMASNIGSAATITGNPQNMMIGSFSHIPYTQFAATLAPVALIGLVATVVLIALFHRSEFVVGARLVAETPPTRIHRVLALRALAATAVLVALFFGGVPPAKAAIIIGGLLLLTRRVRSERVYAEIDWSLLLTFAGLFIIVRGAEDTLLSGDTIAAVGGLHLDHVPVLSAVTAILSNLVSNVPAVLLLKPFIDPLRDPHTAWLTVAMASTLGGNFTILGSIANLIVVQRAAASRVEISFPDHFRVGAPLTVITLVIGRCGCGCDIGKRQAFQPAIAGRRQLPARRRARRPRTVPQCIPGHPAALNLSEVGLVTMIGGLLGLAAQTPIGGAIDEARGKRGAIVVALIVLAIGALVICALPNFWPVLVANCSMAIVGDVFGPAVAALTLGLYTREQLARRIGRNSAFDHAGNVAIAVVAGAVGYAFSQRAVFLLVPVFAVLASIAVLSIPAEAIDFDRARDLDDEVDDSEHPAGPASYGVLFESRPLVIFGLCVMLFHFANAPLLPLVGQKLAAAYPEEATAMMSSCIVAAQLVMLPIALLVGRTADSWGRKPLFLAGFAILPIRAALYTLSDDSVWLIGVQLLDGVGAGVFGALTPLVIADIMRGTGRYNLAQGAIATVHGIGASLSGLAAGVIVDHFGYSSAFLVLAAAAAVALTVFALGMPETADRATASVPPCTAPN